MHHRIFFALVGYILYVRNFQSLLLYLVNISICTKVNILGYQFDERTLHENENKSLAPQLSSLRIAQSVSIKTNPSMQILRKMGQKYTKYKLSYHEEESLRNLNFQIALCNSLKTRTFP